MNLGTVTDAGVGTARMTILNSGNVGIGTTSPAQKLDVNGNILIENGNTIEAANGGSGATTGLWLAGNTAAGNGSYIGLYGTNAINGGDDRRGNIDIGTYSGGGNPGAMHFMTYNGSSWIINATILSSGYVGIGLTNPDRMLEVNGQVEVHDINSGGTDGAIRIKGNASNYGTIQFVNPAGNAQWVSIIGQSTGNTAFSGSVSASNISDQRLKKNITPLNDGAGLAALEKLRPVSFEWKNPEVHVAGKTIGFIAQEVQLAFPDWVHEIKVMGSDNNLISSDQKPLGIDQFPVGFNALVVKAIQELKSLFAIDHDAIAKLKADNDNLRALVVKQGQEFQAYKAAHP